MLTFVQDRFGHFHWDSVPVVKPITGTGVSMGPYSVLQSFDLLDQALRPDVDSASPSNRLAQLRAQIIGRVATTVRARITCHCSQ